MSINGIGDLVQNMLDANNQLWWTLSSRCPHAMEIKMNSNGVGHVNQLLIFISLLRKPNFFKLSLPALILIVLTSLKCHCFIRNIIVNKSCRWCAMLSSLLKKTLLQRKAYLNNVDHERFARRINATSSFCHKHKLDWLIWLLPKCQLINIQYLSLESRRIFG